MVKKFFKRKSKRLTCRKRYKIEKKVREHNRKLKKEEAKHPKKKAKDPGVPNDCPFKESILQEAEARKKRLEEERQKQKDRRKRDREKMLQKKRNLTSLVTEAQTKTQDFERKKEFVESKAKQFTGGKQVETSLKAYYKEFRKVIDAADVILQVLDARDPLGSRCPQVEEAVLSAGPDKRLVLLLNKIDLVPKENVEAWLTYLRNEFPTVAFKASTQSQSTNLSHSKVTFQHASDDLRKSSRCLGAQMLMALLGNYCRNRGIKTSITVGVVGFPNTGKSSIINSLKRSKACNVGATPGVTRSMQAIQLDKNIKLLDSPGIVMATGLSDDAVVLRNCVNVEALEDPVPPVSAVLRRCSVHQMMLQYYVEEFHDVTEFLSLLAKRFGQLKKGGRPDTNKAARRVLNDWNMGKIRYFTHPPESHTLPTHVSSEIVTQMAQEFNVDSLVKDELETLQNLKEGSAAHVVVDSQGPTAGYTPNDDKDEEMPEEEEEDGGNSEDYEDMEDSEDEDQEVKKVQVQSKASKMTKSKEKLGKKDKTVVESTLKGNQQQNKSRKKKKVPTATLR